MTTRKKMKLYVWVRVLKDYTHGMAFAIASSQEEALDLIAKDIGYDDFEDMPKYLKTEFKNETPCIHPVNSSVAYHCSGGG